MASSVTFNGTTYSIPANREPRGWGSSLSLFLVDVANSALSKSGGNFTLTADTNFGATYGIVAKYFKSYSSNISTTGVVRFANNEGIGWRNAANGADKILKLDTGDRLEIDGVDIVTVSSTDTLTNKTLSGNTATNLISGSGTLTLNTSGTITVPNGTDTLVGKATTDILTNKTLSGNTATNLISGSGTLTLNTSGTVTVPNGTDTLVGKATTDTLTNKTLTSPVINNPTGLVKADVGLGNVDNTSDATKNAAAVTLTNKTLTSPIISTISNTGTLTLPTSTDTLVGRATTDTLTNKTLTSPVINTPTGIVKGDVGLGNVDNTSDATKNAATATLTNKTITDPIIDDGLRLNHETSVATPASGKVALFAKSDNQLYVTNSSGITTAVASSGTGEKNYITNPSAASATTGWGTVGDLTLARSTTASELPRENTTATGIKITATSGTQSTADYVYFDFNLDDVDLSKKLKISWSQKYTGSYVAGDFAVGITTQADRTTFLHTPVTTAIPKSDFVFDTTFDCSTTATLSLVIRATTDMTTDAGIVISDIVVGPGTVSQGAAVSEWQSFTPTISNVTSPSGIAGYYRRVGSNMECSVRWSGAATSSTPVTVTIPTGFTINSAALAGGGAATDVFGEFQLNPNTGALYTANVVWASSTTVKFLVSVQTNYYNSTVPMAANAGDIGNARFSIPIAEWAGNGTVNLGAGAQVEYAYNSSVTDGNDTSSFAYGPGGGQFGNFTTQRVKRVRFQYPIQSTDAVALEFSRDSGTTWFRLGQSDIIGTDQTQNSQTYGASLSTISSTDVDVYFNKYRTASGTTFGGAGTDWSAIDNDNTYKWRVVKYKASSPVGFGLAGTDGSAGLVNPYTAGSGVVYSGTYTPTFTNTTNISASSPYLCMYSRVGQVVTVSGGGAVTCTTAASTYSELGISLPIPSNFTLSTDLFGTGSRDASAGTAQTVAQMSADTANDRAYFTFNCSQTGNKGITFTFQYLIK